jgi:hypothetical protein
LTGGDPAQLWAFYLQLTEVEQAFKELKLIWQSARSTIRLMSRSKPTSLSRSWLIACK